jgi:hypothetical protein
MSEHPSTDARKAATEPPSATTDIFLIGRDRPLTVVGAADDVLAQLQGDWASVELDDGGTVTLRVTAVAYVRETVRLSPEQMFPR